MEELDEIYVIGMGVVVACLALAGCIDLPPSSGLGWHVQYLGEDVQEPAIELEDGEVRERFPELVEAMEETRQQGRNHEIKNAFRSPDFHEFRTVEAQEQMNSSEKNRSPQYITEKFGSRFNWTASTYSIHLSGG